MTKFKDSNGRWYTVGIFKELSTNPDTVLYSIEEAKGFYMECDDITGYEFATNYLGGWKHWIALFTSPKVEPLLKDWEEELEVRMRSKAIKNIATLAKGDKGYQASKFLADKGWKAKGTGRPTKEAIQKEARVQNKMYDEFKNNVVPLNK